MKSIVMVVLSSIGISVLCGCNARHQTEGAWASEKCRLDIIEGGKAFFQEQQYGHIYVWTPLDSRRISITEKNGTGFEFSLNPDGSASGGCEFGRSAIYKRVGEKEVKAHVATGLPDKFLGLDEQTRENPAVKTRMEYLKRKAEQLERNIFQGNWCWNSGRDVEGSKVKTLLISLRQDGESLSGEACRIANDQKVGCVPNDRKTLSIAGYASLDRAELTSTQDGATAKFVLITDQATLKWLPVSVEGTFLPAQDGLLSKCEF